MGWRRTIQRTITSTFIQHRGQYVQEYQVIDIISEHKWYDGHAIKSAINTTVSRVHIDKSVGPHTFPGEGLGSRNSIRVTRTSYSIYQSSRHITWSHGQKRGSSYSFQTVWSPYHIIHCVYVLEIHFLHWKVMVLLSFQHIPSPSKWDTQSDRPVLVGCLVEMQ